MVKAGDKTLESYRYAPNNGPLITVAYGNGDTQEILYDKEERIRARRWNGESTDAVRYEYDDYGTLEKETDLVNGRIDKDQYDMTGRLVQSTTLEKNTGAAGEPTVANTHTVQSLEIGYDNYNRVNRLVQSLEGSKTKTGLVYGDASKTQRPGLSYGLTVDGKQRQSLAYDAMARCTKETVTLPGGQKRENCFTYGTLRHLTDTDRDLFTYRTDGWRDQLLSWNGKSYAYDAGGNPTVLRGMALTWGEGHRLKRIAAIEGGATYIAGNCANKVTDMVQFGSKAAEALGNAAVNYTDAETPWTRIIEHKWFEFGKDEEGNDLPKTVISREYSSEWKLGDEPYYPVNDEKNGKLYEEYKKLAEKEENIIFGGRLGEYKYYDMDAVIAAALDMCEKEL